jgi:hypothetical protein
MPPLGAQFEPNTPDADCVRSAGFAARDERTGAVVSLYLPRAQFSGGASANTKAQPFADAVKAYHVNCLSRLHPDDPRWSDPLAQRLRAEVMERMTSYAPRSTAGFFRSDVTGGQLQPRADGRAVLERWTHSAGRSTCTYVDLDRTALRALKTAPKNVRDYVAAFAFGAVAEGPAATAAAKKSHADGLIEANLAKVAALRGQVDERELALLRQKKIALAEAVGFTDDIRAAVGWEGDGLPDERPSAAHLGSPDCPGRARALRAFFNGRSLSPRGVLKSASRESRRRARVACPHTTPPPSQVDKDKDRIRKALGPKYLRLIIEARYPRLVPYPNIIEALAKRAQLDHVFSCACDHPMNLFLEFDLLNSSFSDYNMMALKAAMYTPPVMRAAGDWVRMTFPRGVEVVSLA